MGTRNNLNETLFAAAAVGLTIGAQKSYGPVKGWVEDKFGAKDIDEPIFIFEPIFDDIPSTSNSSDET